MEPENSEKPPLIERLRDCCGNGNRLAKALGAGDEFPGRWLRSGYLPERWAMAAGKLGLVDEWGPITSEMVFTEAARVRYENRLRKARLAKLEKMVSLAKLASKEGDSSDAQSPQTPLSR